MLPPHLLAQFSSGARFSKVPVTFRAGSYILKTKSIDSWRSFLKLPAYQPDVFYQLGILLLSFQFESLVQTLHT